jgi:hypothetical protein
MSARLPSDDRWSAAQNEGDLLLFFPSELRNGIKTSQGETDAVACRTIVNLEAGRVFTDALVFGAALVPNIAGGVPDRPVLGRLNKSDRGAWILLPHSQEELDKAHKWMMENPA